MNFYFRSAAKRAGKQKKTGNRSKQLKSLQSICAHHVIGTLDFTSYFKELKTIFAQANTTQPSHGPPIHNPQNQND